MRLNTVLCDSRQTHSRFYCLCVCCMCTWGCWGGSLVCHWAPPCWSGLNREGWSGSDRCAGLSPLAEQETDGETGKKSGHYEKNQITRSSPWGMCAQVSRHWLLPDRNASFFLRMGRMVVASMVTLDICKQTEHKTNARVLLICFCPFIPHESANGCRAIPQATKPTQSLQK